MGCGISKFDAEEASPKFRRLAKRNVHDANIDNDNNVVSEQLLHEDGAKDGSSPDHNDGKSVSSWPAAKWETDVQDRQNANKGGVGGDERNSQYKGALAVKTLMTEEEGGDGGRRSGCSGGRHSIGDKSEEGRGSASDRDDSIARPASPSFREYVDYASKDDNTDDFAGLIGAKGEKKTPSDQGNLNSEMSQESETEVRKRRKSSMGRGLIKSAMQRPSGWKQRQK